MNRQKSFISDMPSIYLVATPIGNLDDMTFRAVKTLSNVDIIYCEDTRVSSKLLNHFEIKKPLKTYHDFNKTVKTEEILNHLRNNNNIALISDAGYPLISDPGYYLIREVIKEGYNVISIPGPSALLTALVTSGIAPHPFLFYGFLDSKESKRSKELDSLKNQKETMIFYESPHRINKTINTMYNVLGERQLVIARELTKKYEEIIRGTTVTLQDIDNIKGEMVLIVEGKKDESVNTDIPILDEVNDLIEQGLSSKDAIKQVTKNRNLHKNIVYMEYHKQKEE